MYSDLEGNDQEILRGELLVITLSFAFSVGETLLTWVQVLLFSLTGKCGRAFEAYF